MSRIPKFESKLKKPQAVDVLKELPVLQNRNQLRLRRSKSFDNLRNAASTFTVETKTIQKINTISTVNPGRVQTKLKFPSSQSVDKVPELPVIKNRPVRVNLRRSKSFSDLKASSNVDNSKFKSSKPGPSNLKGVGNKVSKVGTSSFKPNLNKPVVKSNVSTRTGVKRQGESCDTEVKNKIIKKTKVPDWDFKTRFGILQEKYSILQNDHKTTSKILEDLKKNSSSDLILQRNLKEQVEKLSYMYEESAAYSKELKIKYDSTKKDLEETKINFETLTNKFNEVIKHSEELNMDLEEYKEKYYDFKNKYEKCVDEKENMSERIDNMSEKIEHLMREIYDGEKIRRVLHNEIQDLKGNIRVFCRLRPALTDEEKLNQCDFTFPDSNSIKISKRKLTESVLAPSKSADSQEFTFDRVFDSNSTQESIFEELSQLVQSAMDGYHVCVFAYGQTGSGKTYTMQGDSYPSEAVGMIPRSVQLLFRRIKEVESLGWSYKIEASFLEVYNENIRDLLNLKSGKSLDIRYNEGRGTTVPNLTVVSISTVEELAHYILKSQQNRSTAVTNYNEHSSRSHAVTKIYIESRFQYSNEVYVGSLSLVDLAGSESAKFVSNERLPETKNINKSLSNLGNVLMALHNKDAHVPYRNSKLTFLLQSSLGGNCKCLMIVNISPVIDSFNESINALRFAAKVKEVKISSVKNKMLITPSK